MHGIKLDPDVLGVEDSELADQMRARADKLQAEELAAYAHELKSYVARKDYDRAEQVAVQIEARGGKVNRTWAEKASSRKAASSEKRGGKDA